MIYLKVYLYLFMEIMFLIDCDINDKSNEQDIIVIYL